MNGFCLIIMLIAFINHPVIVDINISHTMSCTWLNCTDAGGETIKVESFDGLYFPPKPIPVTSEEQCHAIRDMDVRVDDIFILSYPKSGTHWLWELVTMVVSGGPNFVRDRMPVYMLDITAKDDLEAMTSPRVLCSHFRFRYIPQQIPQKKNKVFMIHRNPKDVAVSTYGMYTAMTSLATYSGKWDDYFDLWLPGKVPYNSWFDYVLEWQKELDSHPEFDIMHVQYEEMKRDPVGHVKKIASYLDRELSEESCQSIAEACSFKKMRAAYDSSEVKADKLKGEWKDGSGNGIFRKGEVGDWKNWFTVAQNERFNLEYQKRMTENKWTYTYEL